MRLLLFSDCLRSQVISHVRVFFFFFFFMQGSNMPGEPIYISQIKEGGVAFR